METPWACFGGLGADVGAPEGFLEALGEHFEAPGWLREPSGMLQGQFVEALLVVCRTIWECLLRVLWKPASSFVLVLLGTFWFTSFAKFAKWQRSFPLESSQLNCNLFFDARACEHQWNLTKTVLGRAPKSHGIPTETGKITS